MRIYSGILSVAVIGTFGWVWNTTAQVQSLTKDVSTQGAAVAVIPQMQIDIALIKQSQAQAAKDTSEIKDAVKNLADAERRRN